MHHHCPPCTFSARPLRKADYNVMCYETLISQYWDGSQLCSKMHATRTRRPETRRKALGHSERKHTRRHREKRRVDGDRCAQVCAHVKDNRFGGDK